MKKIALISLAAIAALVSCQKEDFTNEAQTGNSPVFTASITTDETKTTLSDDSPAKILWESSDKITITDGSSHTAVYKLSDGEGTKSGTFIKDSGDDLDNPGTYTATYGAVPSAYQVYSSAGSVPLYMTAPATSSTDGLVFTAQCGVLRATLTDTSHDIMRVEVSDASGNTYRVTSSSAVDIASATKFYIALPAGTYTTMNIYDNNWQMVSKTGIELAVTAGHVKPAVSSSLTFTDCTTKGFKNINSVVRAIVQLWADGPFWSETNIGADTPEAYGQYFAWGYTEGCIRNSAGNGWVLASDGTTAKVFKTADFSKRETATYQDAATANWGTGWSVPTNEDFTNLKSSSYTSIENVTTGTKGIKVTGKTSGYTSNSIFLPAAGCGYGSGLDYAGDHGNYWSSVQKSGSYAYNLFFDSGDEDSVTYSEKYFGYSVRPVYSEAPAPTTGTAKATISGQEVEVAWVQLWADGPKFAVKNVGADTNTDIGSVLTFSDATKTGANYEWGSNWKTPTKGEMDLLNTSKVSCTYCQESGVYGFKFTGVQEGYTGNSLFLPAENADSDSGSADYWSSTAEGTNAWYLYLRYNVGDYDESAWENSIQSYQYYVRPVLSN